MTGLRPSSNTVGIIAQYQYNLENTDVDNISKHRPRTPKLSQLVDSEKISETNASFSEKTTKWMEFAVLLDPLNSIIWNNLGFLYKKNGNLAKSENCLRQCINHNPLIVSAFHILAHILTSQGFYKKALLEIERGLANHDTFDLHNSKALCLLELGAYDESFLEAMKSIDLIVKESSWDVHIPNEHYLFTVLVAVRALLASDRKSEIIHTYKPLLTMYPNNAIFFNNFGYFLYKDGQNEQAKKNYMKCLSIEHDNWSALFGLGIIFHKEKNFVDSKAYFDKSLKNCPASLQDDIKQRKMESLEKFMDEQAKKTFSEQVSELGGFSITGNRQTDVKNFVSLLSKCSGSVLWVDPYFSKEGFVWLEEACTKPTEIKQVRVLTTKK